jgi:hypothetical protein
VGHFGGGLADCAWLDVARRTRGASISVFDPCTGVAPFNFRAIIRNRAKPSPFALRCRDEEENEVMRKLPLTTVVGTIAAVALMCACATVDPHEAQSTTQPLPDIGSRTPDGRVYAGLSMTTGKPSYIDVAGGKMPDGTVYAGISPDTGRRLFTTPADAPGIYTWGNAIEYCKSLPASGHHDWRMPTISELAVLFSNRADIGQFNETGQLQHASGYYWSTLLVGDDDAWGQRFNDGFHEDFSKSQDSSLRCVR